MSDSRIFARLRPGRRYWAVAAVHGEAARLAALHRALARRFAPGDRLVYLGNLMGHGPAVGPTLDEVIAFRRRLLARPGLFVCDLAFLRGSQEEMWDKLLRLQMAPNPAEVLDWMLARGVGATLAAYDGAAEEGRACARAGALAITRWTNSLRARMRARPGHAELMAALRRAAYVEAAEGGLLFVHTGLDPSRPLSAQADSFWWESARFAALEAPFEGFRKVVRGFDPAHGGLVEGPVTLSLDGGCGFGGPLLAACLDPAGRVVDLIEA